MEMIKFIVMRSALYGVLSIIFSFLSIFVTIAKIPRPTILNPIEVIGFISIEHVFGHIVFGMIAGIVTKRLRYVILVGLFAILVDADRVLVILNILPIPRMAHSIPFAIFAAVIMMLVFGKKDLKLISTSFAAVFVHMSLDILSGRAGNFLLFAPFSSTKIYFPGTFWIHFLLLAIAIIGAVTLIERKYVKTTN